MNSPQVSVVMTVFNAQDYVGEAVESILHQTFSDFEFVIVDDGSTDNSWKMLSAYAASDGRILLLRNQLNMGVVHALNTGMASARGEYIARQDADDFSSPTRLALQAAFLDKHPEIGVVATAAQLVETDGTPISVLRAPARNDEIQRELFDHMCLVGPSIMTRRQCFNDAGGCFSDGLDASEDYDLCLRLADVTQVASLDVPLYYYRQHPESASRKRAAQQAYNAAIALERANIRRFGSTCPEARFLVAARQYFRAVLLGCANQDVALARRSLERTLALYRRFLSEEGPLGMLVRAYTPLKSTEAALAYTKSLFDDVLPRTRRLSHLKSRLLSDLHMSKVFSGTCQNVAWHWDGHLWLGIRNNPTWLLNRGVISVLVKSLLSRAQEHDQFASNRSGKCVD